MPDAAIENAIEALKKRRDELDAGIRALEGFDGGSTQASRTVPVAKKSTGRKRRTMSAAVRAKLRATYAKNHPGWKPKKK